MARIVISARGEKIDFDLFGIKQAMAAIPVTDNVKKREKFINKKRRRGLKRRTDELAQKAKLEEDNAKAVRELSVDDSADDSEYEDSSDTPETTPTKKKRKVGG